MDPVSLVVGALTAGARATFGETKAAVADTYQALKQRVASELAGHPRDEIALEEYEADPETWTAPLAKAVERSGAADDTEVVALAQQVFELVDPPGAEAGKYVISVADPGGAQIHGNFNIGAQRDFSFNETASATDLPAGGGAGSSPGLPVADDD